MEGLIRSMEVQLFPLEGTINPAKAVLKSQQEF